MATSNSGSSREALLGQVERSEAQRSAAKRSEAPLAELLTARAERDGLQRVLTEERRVSAASERTLIEELRSSDEQLASVRVAMSEDQRGAATLTRLLIACQERLAELEDIFGSLASHSGHPATLLCHVASLKLHSLPGAAREERSRRLAAVEACLELQLQAAALAAPPQPAPPRRPLGLPSPPSANPAALPKPIFPSP